MRKCEREAKVLQELKRMCWDRGMSFNCTANDSDDKEVREYARGASMAYQEIFLFIEKETKGKGVKDA